MSARQPAADLRPPCPISFAYFLAFVVIAYGPDQAPTPGLRDKVDLMLSHASRAGFAHVDLITTMIANGETDTPRVLQLATVLGEFIGESEIIKFIEDFSPKRKAGEV